VPSVSRPSNGKSHTSFPYPGHETTEGRETSHELLNILDVPDLAYFSDGRDVVGVRFNVALGDDVPQELSPGDPEGAFIRVQLDVEPPEVVEGFFHFSLCAFFVPFSYLTRSSCILVSRPAPVVFFLDFSLGLLQLCSHLWPDALVLSSAHREIFWLPGFIVLQPVWFMPVHLILLEA
jgi:hypothetical protein